MESIELTSLSKTLSKEISTYTDEVVSMLLAKLDETADKILDYIKTHAPRTSSAKSHLGDSFIKESYGEGINKTIVIYSKTKGSIVHLVELGFRHRSGKYVAARPFLRPAYDEFTPKMLEDIKAIIKGDYHA